MKMHKDGTRNRIVRNVWIGTELVGQIYKTDGWWVANVLISDSSDNEEMKEIGKFRKRHSAVRVIVNYYQREEDADVHVFR